MILEFLQSTFKYLFTFVSNCLMEMITEHDNYEHLAWSVGVRLRGNLDSIHTWAEQFGLGNDFKKVSAKLSEGRGFLLLRCIFLFEAIFWFFIRESHFLRLENLTR